MKKIYILDTNVLINDPKCFFKFEDNDIRITPVTLKEIDGLKKRDGEIGYAARQVKNVLDSLRNLPGDIAHGIKLPGGGFLYCTKEISYDGFPIGLQKDTPDSLILAAANKYRIMHENVPESPECILVTDDINMAIFADVIGIKNQKYKSNDVDIDAMYSGRKIIKMDSNAIDNFYQNNELYLEDDYPANMFVTLEDIANPKHSALGKIDTDETNKIIPLTNLVNTPNPFDINLCNSAQKFFADALLSDIPLNIAIGPAGTAKTFLALGCGLEQVMNQHKYKQVLITRANVKMDNEYGFLPGSEMDKISPMLRPIFDNIEALFDGEKFSDDKNKSLSISEYLFDQGIIKAESMEYMRGRSLKDTYLIIDEAQNCTPSQILAIITRIGSGCKVVLVGDPFQIDNKYLSKNNNGIVFAADRFVKSKLCAQIRFENKECKRSLLAMEASRRLAL